MTFAEKVRKRLAELKRTQADLAKAVGTNQPQVSNWLNQGVVPSTEYAMKAAKFLGLSLDYLLDDSLEEPACAELDTAEQLLLDLAREMGPNTALRQLFILQRGPAFEPKGPPFPEDAAARDRIEKELGRLEGLLDRERGIIKSFRMLIDTLKAERDKLDSKIVEASKLYDERFVNVSCLEHAIGIRRRLLGKRPLKGTVGKTPPDPLFVPLTDSGGVPADSADVAEAFPDILLGDPFPDITDLVEGLDIQERTEFPDVPERPTKRRSGRSA